MAGAGASSWHCANTYQGTLIDQGSHVAPIANQRIVLEPHVQNAMQLGGQRIAEAVELVARYVQQLFDDDDDDDEE